MKKLVTCRNSGRLDKDVIEAFGLGDDSLMEVAALRVWQALQVLILDSGLGSRKSDCRIVALCGSGNNAADGLVVLRHAGFAGFGKISVVFTRNARSGDTETDQSGTGTSSLSLMSSKPEKEGLVKRKVRSLQALGVPMYSWKDEPEDSKSILSKANIILDCIAGTGIHGMLDADSSEAAGFISRLHPVHDGGPLIVSVDVPSGMSEETRQEGCIVRAGWTLAIEPLKTCLYAPATRSFAGRILPVSGVFPVSEPVKPDAVLLESSDLEELLVRDDPSLYKTVRGRLAVFAGSDGMAGATFLASTASLRSGAGYVAVFCDPSVIPVLSMKSNEVVIRSSVNAAPDLDPGSWDAILAGPGWKVNTDSEALLVSLLATGIPVVLDAGAVELFASLFMKGVRSASTVILTPHPGEFKRLVSITGVQGTWTANDIFFNPADGLKDLAKRLGVMIILKGQVTWIACPQGEVRIWDGQESGLGTAGSGDVLAGLAGGLAAHWAAAGKMGSSAGSCERMVGALGIACSAVIAHGIAGQNLRKKRGWFVAGDLIEEAGKNLDPSYWSRTTDVSLT